MLALPFILMWTRMTMYRCGQRLLPIQLLLLMMALLGQRLRPIHQLHPLVLAPPGQRLRPIQPQPLVLALPGQQLRPIQPQPLVLALPGQRLRPIKLQPLALVLVSLPLMLLPLLSTKVFEDVDQLVYSRHGLPQGMQLLLQMEYVVRILIKRQF